MFFGHRHYRNVDEAFSDSSEALHVHEGKARIIAEMNCRLKDTSSIIRQNQFFFNCLSEINQIIVLGHSLNEIDWPYMKEEISKTGKDKSWHISYHSQQDLHQIDIFKREMGLSNVSCFPL